MTTKHWPISGQRPTEVVSSATDNLKSRLLEGLTQPDLGLILTAATPRRFAANSVVLNQGDPADYLFLITKGYARHFFTTQEGRKVLLLWLGPGDVFGGASLLFRPSSYLLSTETVKDSCVLVWRRNTIRELARHYPALLENALSLASDYLSWFLAAHIALISHTARERVAGVLVSLAEGIGQKVPGGVKLDITNEQLANAANVTPFTASRIMSEWQRNGAIAKSRGSIVLRAPQRLFLHQV
jgi:CRP/FNR family transcriptional regulator, nitrogen oxide reductase regulator